MRTCGLEGQFGPRTKLCGQSLGDLPCGSEGLFVKLDAYANVKRADDRVPERYFDLVSNGNGQTMETRHGIAGELN